MLFYSEKTINMRPSKYKKEKIPNFIRKLAKDTVFYLEIRNHNLHKSLKIKRLMLAYLF